MTKIEMTYHAHLEGFSRDFDSLDDLRDWANDLAAIYGCLDGKSLKIWRARSIVGTCAEFISTPDREIVIGGKDVVGIQKCADCDMPAIMRQADNTPLCTACDQARYEARKPEIDRRLHERLGHLGW